MTSQYHIYDMLQDAKVKVTLDGCDLIVTPSSSVTPALAEFIRQNKSELVAMLERGRDLPLCGTCGGSQIAVRTFDGYENFECPACNLCSGCRKVPA